MKNIKRVTILGAGPGGLTAAWYLSKNGIKVNLIEKEAYIGGLGGSFKYKDYWLDYGPHAFHIKDQELTDIICSLSHERPKKLAMTARLLFKGRYLDYPVSIAGILKNLNPAFSVNAVMDFLIAGIVRIFHKDKKATSFKDWGVKRYGKTIYKMAFGDYTQKVWGMPTELLSYRLAEQKLPNLNLVSFLKDVFRGRRSEQRMHYSNYFYPQDGVGKIFDKMYSDIKSSGADISLSSRVDRIELKDKSVRSIIVTDENHKEKEMESDAVISTIPLRALFASANKLRYRQLILVYLIINKNSISDAMMVYLLDPLFKFNRFSEQKNISKRMIPLGKTVLCFEICCNKDDLLWKSSDDEIYSILLSDIKKVPYVSINDIESFFIKRLDDIYPVFDLEFDKNLQDCLSYASGIENLYLTGRHGLFINNDMHDTMQISLMAAKYVHNGTGNSKEWLKLIKKHLGVKLAFYDV